MKNLLFIILFYFSNISFLWASSDASSLLLSQEKKIISSSKDEESVFNSAASVFVLNSQDIMRSGATSLPELLRLVPGVEVAQSTYSELPVINYYNQFF
jgi:outer membrane cobalamin receptor